MAKKSYYAVRKGLATGIFSAWEECQAATRGYSGAEFKGFAVLEEAQRYLDYNMASVSEREAEKPAPDKVIAYVDGSYDHSLQKYAYGCVILTPSGETVEKHGNGEDPQGLAIRNVAGEMLGAMTAVSWAMKNGYAFIELRYDYEGVEKWVTGAWSAKNDLTRKYAKAMKNWQCKIRIEFCKVKAHSGNKYNDRADALAKAALEESCTI